jgi:mycothiol synthase
MWIGELTPAQAAQVAALAERAQQADGVDPLNEEARLSLRQAGAQHYLVGASDRLDGYLNYHPAFATAQLVVDPAHRRRGIASRLWAELPGSVGSWAFGNLPAAQGFAADQGLVAERRLLMMSRSLHAVESTTANPDLDIRSFTPTDAEAFLTVNAAAFAEHHEQGRLDEAALAARIAEDWFDPDGFLLGFDDHGLAGFHWTKADDGVGEVYVIGVAPRAQGRGYGKALLEAGISHLAAKGLPTVLLFVDAADQIAVRMYERAGFGLAREDVYYVAGTKEQ